jgi:hypothetical protein
MSVFLTDKNKVLIFLKVFSPSILIYFVFQQQQQKKWNEK